MGLIGKHRPPIGHDHQLFYVIPARAQHVAAATFNQFAADPPTHGSILQRDCDRRTHLDSFPGVTLHLFTELIAGGHQARDPQAQEARKVAHQAINQKIADAFAADEFDVSVLEQIKSEHGDDSRSTGKLLTAEPPLSGEQVEELTRFLAAALRASGQALQKHFGLGTRPVLEKQHRMAIENCPAVLEEVELDDEFSLDPKRLRDRISELASTGQRDLVLTTLCSLLNGRVQAINDTLGNSKRKRANLKRGTMVANLRSGETVDLLEGPTLYHIRFTRPPAISRNQLPLKKRLQPSAELKRAASGSLGLHLLAFIVMAFVVPASSMTASLSC